jgi:hypothetical protein
MNKKNIKTLIAFLKKLPDRKFDMESTTKYCGTVGCIAGWSMALRRDIKAIPAHRSIFNAFQDAGEWLGLTDKQTRALFNPYNYHSDCAPEDLSKAQAINVLKNLMETGRVAWNKKFEKA